MGKYLYVYKGGTVADTDEAREASMAAWGAWIAEVGDAFVDVGNPTGASTVVGANGAGGTASGVSGYSLVQAESLDEAAAKAKGCPVLAGGGSVEVYETFDVM
jgi:hypothetical protein